MNIKAFHVYQYTLPLKFPLILKGKHLSSREGILIKLTDESGNVGWGEAAPLLGFSLETFEQAKAEVLKLQTELTGTQIPENILQFDSSFKKWLTPFKLSPSVQFGFEAAVLNLVGNACGKPLRKILNPEAHDEIKICALLKGSIDEVIKEAKTLMTKGFTAFKLKVGTDELEEDIKKVRSLYDVLLGQALLRLDANQNWSMNEAIHFSNEVGLATAEYIEEPFKDPKDATEFVDKTTIPVALDESIKNYAFEEIRKMHGIDILVIKPTILGGIGKSWKLIQEAQRTGISVIISSTFESSIGISALVNLAAAVRIEYPAGLDTLKWFEEDTLKNRIYFDSGIFDLKDLPVDFTFNEKLLTSISA